MNFHSARVQVVHLPCKMLNPIDLDSGMFHPFIGAHRERMNTSSRPAIGYMLHQQAPRRSCAAIATKDDRVREKLSPLQNQNPIEMMPYCF